MGPGVSAPRPDPPQPTGRQEVTTHIVTPDAEERRISAANLADVPQVTNDQLRHIWGWLSACPGERPLAAAIEQALASARRELPSGGV